MTIIPERYVCNVCGETKSHAYTYGLRFTSTGRELEEHKPDHVNIHLCSRCVTAIRRPKINESEPETPAEDPPNKTEEPSKPSQYQQVGTSEVRKFLQTRGYDQVAIGDIPTPVIVRLRCLLGELYAISEGPGETEDPTLSAEHLDADGIPIEVGRLYWIEVVTGTDRMLWVQIKTLKVGGGSVTIWRGPERGIFPVEPHRLCRHHPEEWKGPPNETEEPDKPAVEMTLDQARELAKACLADDYPGAGLDQYGNVAAILELKLTLQEGAFGAMAAELAEAERKLEAQARAPRGVLEWYGIGTYSFQAAGRHPEAGAYFLHTSRGSYSWEAMRKGASLHVGTLYECQAACEAMESSPEAIPFGIDQKEDVCPKT